MIQAIYRATPASNKKHRPEWFMKRSCLGSFLRAAEVGGIGHASILFLCDGPLPEGVVSTMERRGRVEQLGGIGNSQSYLAALRRAVCSGLASDDIVYFVEDDYLHAPDALTCLGRAIADAPSGSYMTLYDHPDRYRQSDDLRTPGRAVELFGDRHCRRVESTNMTFAARVGTLRRDRRLLALAARYTGYPHDRAMWRALQGLGPYLPLRTRGRRVLFGAVPSLATHVEPDALAPGIDWRQLSDDADEWLSTEREAEGVRW